MSAKHCSVPHCVSNRKRSAADISFHMFPKDEDLREEWILKIKSNEGSSYKEISETGFVCSKHFKKEDFAWSAAGTRKRLKRGTVPSKFPWKNRQKDAAVSSNITQILPVASNGLRNGASATEPHSITREREELQNNTKERVELQINKKEMVEAQNSTTDWVEVHNNTKEWVQAHINAKERLEAESNVRNREQVLALQDRVVKLQAKIEKKDRDFSRKFTECELLTQRLSVERFGLNRFCRNDAMIQFYTGFPSYTQFIAFFLSVKPSDDKESAYHTILHSSSVSGPMKDLQLVDELFMFMCCLHAGLLLEDLADRFNINISLVHRTIVTWCNYLYLFLSQLPVWLSREAMSASTPVCFKELYPNTRVIIDFTELKAETPELLNPEIGSVSKSWCGISTLRGLLGLAPSGAVVFLSELFVGPVSDAHVLTESGILKLLDHGDSVMANVGDGEISQLIEADNATLTEPLFCGNTENDLPPREETDDTRQNFEEMDFALRQYLKNIIWEVKRSRLFGGVIPCNLSGHIQQLWTVNCLLCNFREPVVI
ncbi:uncharacterized protein [Asterias amurensis]|uniref:uncharacterized protein n=1 Tax=Asterias amurensis TaxID=7602 RepID=UPI003AB76A0F